MDIYFFSTLLNIIWYIFTIIFVLYKFTSFFSYAYNFFRFCGKLFNGVVWLKNQVSDYIQRKRGYIRLSNDHEILLPQQNKQHQSIFQKLYNNTYNFIFGKQSSPNQPIQLDESIRESYIDKNQRFFNTSNNNPLLNNNRKSSTPSINISIESNQDYNSFNNNSNKSNCNKSNINTNNNNDINNYFESVLLSSYPIGNFTNQHNQFNHESDFELQEIKSDFKEPKPYNVDSSSMLMHSDFIHTIQNKNIKPSNHIEFENLD
jgi:hypothetical protein